MEAVQLAVHRCIVQLSGTSVNSNNHSLDDGDSYRFRARTKDELIASQQEVAAAGGTNPRATFEQLVDPATEIASPIPPKAVSPKQAEGWLM